jgi:hypothetical protein
MTFTVEETVYDNLDVPEVNNPLYLFLNRQCVYEHSRCTGSQ